MESPDLASDDQQALGDCPIEANTPLEEGVPTVSPPDVEEVGMDASLGVVIASTPPPNSTDAGLSKKWLPDRVLVSTYVSPLERVHPSTDMVVLNLEDVLKLSTVGTPSTRRNFLLRTCATFIRITFGYPWRLV